MAAEPAVVVEILPNAAYRVELGNRERVVAHLAPGRLRNFVRLRVRDEVLVERTALDPARARIVELVRGRSQDPGV
jgi:translation initiation factor IF-1